MDPMQERAEFIRQSQERIEKHGYTFVAFADETAETADKNFIHTIGLVAQGLPEVFMAGALPMEFMQAAISQLVNYWYGNQAAVVGMIPDFFQRQNESEHLPVYVQVCNPQVGDENFMEQVGVVYPQLVTGRFLTVQLCWPDSAGRMPFEEDYDVEGYPQFMLPRDEEAMEKASLATLNKVRQPSDTETPSTAPSDEAADGDGQ